MVVSVLCTCERSAYAAIDGVECYGVDRDAYTFGGGGPVVAHPPCRAWGKLKRFSKADEREKALAPFCVEIVRRHGGVLEHPKGSSLWAHCQLPTPKAGGLDAYGGWTVEVDPYDWGFPAHKPTYLYIVGASPIDVVATVGFPERNLAPPK